MTDQATAGHSLRDMLAANAPITLSMAVEVMGLDDDVDMTSLSQRAAMFAVMAKLRYEYADAMLAARARPEVG